MGGAYPAPRATARAVTSAGHRAPGVGVRDRRRRRPGGAGCGRPRRRPPRPRARPPDRPRAPSSTPRAGVRRARRSPRAPCGCWRRSVADRPGIMWSTIRSRACCRSPRSSTSRACADHDRGAVVHRVVEGRAPGDQSVELGDGHADGRRRRGRAASRRPPSRGGRACRPRPGPSGSTANADGSTTGCSPSWPRRRARPGRRRGGPCSAPRSVDRAVAAAVGAWCGRWARGVVRHGDQADRQVACAHGPIHPHLDRPLPDHAARSPSTGPTPDRSASSSPTRSADLVLAGTLAPRRPAAQHPRAGRRPRRVPRGGRAGVGPAAWPRAGSRARQGSGTYVDAAAPAPVPTPTSRRSAPPPRRPLVRLDAGTPWIDARHARRLAAGLARGLVRDRRRAGTTTRAACPSPARAARRAARPHPRACVVDPDDVRGHRRDDRRACATS